METIKAPGETLVTMTALSVYETLIQLGRLFQQAMVVRHERRKTHMEDTWVRHRGAHRPAQERIKFLHEYASSLPKLKNNASPASPPY